MIKRHSDPERDAIPDINSIPVPDQGNSIARKAASAKTRNRNLARKLRKNSQMVSLSADISSGIEEIATLSDKIIEFFETAKQSLDRAAKDSIEERKLWRSISESSGKAQEISQANIAVGEETALAFKRSSRSLEEMLDSVQKGAQVHNEILKKSQELGKLNEFTDDLVFRTNSLFERADIAALNSDLEAGKAGDLGAGFAVIAGMLRKNAGAFQKRAENFNSLLTRIKSIHNGISSRITESSEKIRTVDVLTAGVRHAFDEISGSIDIL
ncbi:MAG: methyl-accepting chemotaxis protein, partial [Candidatus Latescibacterota bacterium]